jgi:uncharacterized membrane protein YecN with MAPEG domain
MEIVYLVSKHVINFYLARITNVFRVVMLVAAIRVLLLLKLNVRVVKAKQKYHVLKVNQTFK